MRLSGEIEDNIVNLWVDEVDTLGVIFLHHLCVFLHHLCIFLHRLCVFLHLGCVKSLHLGALF